MGRPTLFPGDCCYVCGDPRTELHHVFPSGRRKASDREGCTVRLCREHHQGRSGAHQDREFDMRLKAECQKRWEDREGVDEPDHESFRAIFGRNYL